MTQFPLLETETVMILCRDWGWSSVGEHCPAHVRASVQSPVLKENLLQYANLVSFYYVYMKVLEVQWLVLPSKLA